MHQILFRGGRLQRLPRTTGRGRPTSKGDGREKEGRGLRKKREGKKCSVPPPTFEYG